MSEHEPVTERSGSDQGACSTPPARPQIGSDLKSTSKSTSSSSDALPGHDDVDEALKGLRERGVDNPEAQLKYATAAGILGAIRWWDERRATTKVGPGLLVMQLQKGGMPRYSETPPSLCPWSPELELEWAKVTDTLEQTVSEDDWIMRYAPWIPRLHPHSFNDVTGWELGAEKWVLGWLGGRVDGLRKAAGRPVNVVVCEGEI